MKSLREVVKVVTNQRSKENNDPWINSQNECFKQLRTPQEKGKVGVLLYQNYLLKSGFETNTINDQGDIEFRRPGEVTWSRDEVKTASASMTYRKKDGGYTKECWFNQIRPNQEAWTAVTLVAVFPAYYQIYRMSRKEYFENRLLGTAGITPGHTGTDELDQIKLLDNTRKNNYNEWELIYEGA